MGGEREGKREGGREGEREVPDLCVRVCLLFLCVCVWQIACGAGLRYFGDENAPITGIFVFPKKKWFSVGWHWYFVFPHV